MKYLKYINESVKVCDYKEWQKFINIKSYEDEEEFFKLFPDHDKRYNRIYFPLKVNKKNIPINEIPKELIDYIEWNGYKIIDYNDGIIQRHHTGYDNGGRPSKGRPLRIGKYLNKVGRQDLLNTYNNSKKDTLKNVDDLYVVISRHPYDLTGMSTNRGWSTCLDLNDDRYGGKHIHHLQNFVRNGHLVAYLIRKTDRNINDPISRIFIEKRRDGIAPNYKYRYIKDYGVYGTNIQEFNDLVKKWCELHTSYNFLGKDSSVFKKQFKNIINEIKSITIKD